jgi:hypothetical protein
MNRRIEAQRTKEDEKRGGGGQLVPQPRAAGLHLLSTFLRFFPRCNFGDTAEVFFRPWRDSLRFLPLSARDESLGYYLWPYGLGWCNDKEFLPHFRFLHNIRVSRSVFLHDGDHRRRWPPRFAGSGTLRVALDQ